MKTSIKLLHCADIHLDSPFASCDAETASRRRGELRGTFLSLLSYARQKEIDLVLIAGDLFDRPYITPELTDMLRREFAAMPKCRFVISPGNHDPYTADSPYARVDFSENVLIFRDFSLDCFHLDDLGVDIYGYAFTQPNHDYSPLKGFRVENPDRLNLLCAHGDLLSGASQSCPLKPEEFSAAGFDYAALGHIHNTDGIHRINDTLYGYSGCPEGRDFGECGYKGAIFATLTKEDGRLSSDVHGLRFSRRRYEIADIDLTGVTTADEAYDRIISSVKKTYGSDTSLRIVLSGSVGMNVSLNEAYLREKLSTLLYTLEVQNLTVPLFDYELLQNDPTIRGEFFRRLLPDLQSEDAQKRRTASLALRYGLAALGKG